MLFLPPSVYKVPELARHVLVLACKGESSEAGVRSCQGYIPKRRGARMEAF